MTIRILILGLACTILALPSLAQQNPRGLALPSSAKIRDKFTPCPPGDVKLTGGFLGTRIAANEKNRMLTVDEDDMLDCFERREVRHQDWQGEHVGKFLHAAVLSWQNSGDADLKVKIDRVAARLLKTQEPDGYLGTYMPDHRWTSWDVWVHKYDLIGLLTYYQYTHDLPESDPSHDLSEEALAACRKIGDLLAATFGTGPGQRDINKSGEHMGMAPDSVLEPVVLLYRATKEPRYLAFARYIIANYDAPGGPAILTSLEKYGSVRRVANAKAYEMTSNFNGMLELYRVTGDKRLLDDMLVAWNDIVKNRLYPTGSASSHELYQEDFHLPNGNRANICETCVTVTWEQMNLELLRLTGLPQFAEEIERLAYNHLLAAQKPTGDDWVYYTPLEGRKQYDKVTTCCHSSGPRGVALLPEAAVMISDDGGVVVNLYNSGTMTVMPKPGKVTLDEETAYPLQGTVKFTVTPERDGARFPLRLRIPAWCPEAALQINGQPVKEAPVSGTYATVNRRWKRGDTVTLELKLPTRLTLGDHENEGKAAVLYGPLVLALDTALNPDIRNLNQVELAEDDSTKLRLNSAEDRANSGEAVFATDGRLFGSSNTTPLYLTPFATAGQDGKSRFAIWIARPGKAALPAAGSLFEGAETITSRQGNQSGEINDGDADSFRVTFSNQLAEEDWFGLVKDVPVEINRVVYIHGKSFHDGGWFDVSGGKPRIQVQTEKDGDWKTVGTIEDYPATTAVNNARLRDGQRFEVKFAAVKAVAIRVIGKPSSGDNPAQAFSSCAELQAFLDK